jgi:hypothetical protein
MVSARELIVRSGRAWARDPARALGVLVIAGGLVVSLIANLPGHMSYDSVLQLAQGRSGVYNEWHPPVMAWLMGAFDAVARGTGLFVAFDSVLLFGSLAAIVLISPRPGWWTPALALVLVATPDWLIYPGIVWKDVLFAAAALSSFTALAAAETRWGQRRARDGLIVLAVALGALAALSRQNGILILPPMAVALAWIGARGAKGSRAKAAAAWGLLPVAGAVALTLAAGSALHARSDGEPSRAYQVADLQAYDLAAALKLSPGLKLEVLDARAPRLAAMIRVRAAPAYTPERIDPITAMADLDQAELEAPKGVLTGQWLQLVLRHPGLYLQARAEDFAWVLFTPDIDSCVPFFVGVEGPEPWMAQLGMVNHERAQDKALKAYGEALTATPLFWHGAYGLIALVALGLLLRRREDGDIAMAALLAAALVFTASFFVISVACDYRYLYFLDVAAMTAALRLAGTWRRAR